MDNAQLDKRIEAVNDTVKRTRSALFLCILASGAMFLCLWNTYASWDRDFVFSDSKDAEGIQSTDKRERDAKAWSNHVKGLPPQLVDHQIRSWVDTQVVAVSLLGIKISVSDFAFLGSGALFICSFYFLLCTRRENHEIGYLFQDLRLDLEKVGYHAYSMVSSFMVFNLSGSESAGGTDGVITSLEKSVGRRIRFIRVASSVLYFLPAITLFSTIVCDFGWAFTQSGHLFFVSPFRFHPERAPFLDFEPGERWYFCCAESFALIMAITLCRISVLIRSYETGTRGVLEHVYHTLVSRNVVEQRWKEPKKDEDGRAAAATIP